MPDKTDEKQGKFRKGRSGNPMGRPRGIRNKTTLLAEALFEGETEGICRKAIEEAKQGNTLQKTKNLESEKCGDIVISENVSGNVPMTGLPSLRAASCPVLRAGCARLLRNIAAHFSSGQEPSSWLLIIGQNLEKFCPAPERSRTNFSRE